MKGLFGIAGLLLALAIAGLLIRQQLTTAKPALPLLTPGPAGAGKVATPTAQELPQQYRQALEAAMQSRPAVPDEK